MAEKLQLGYTIEDWLGRVTLSNPPNNLLTRPDFEDPERLRKFLETPQLKAVIIQGEGRHFCGGADLDSLSGQLADPKQMALLMGKGKALLEIVRGATVPVMALVRGSCLGAGLEIALACHFRFSSSNAMLGFPESEHGFMPGFSGTLTAPATTGFSGAMDLIISGKMVRGDEAASLGLVDKAVPSKELEPAAIAYLRSLTEGRTIAQIRAILTAIHKSTGSSHAEAQKLETDLFIKLSRGEKPNLPGVE